MLKWCTLWFISFSRSWETCYQREKLIFICLEDIYIPRLRKRHGRLAAWLFLYIMSFITKMSVLHKHKHLILSLVSMQSPNAKLIIKRNIEVLDEHGIITWDAASFSKNDIIFSQYENNYNFLLYIYSRTENNVLLSLSMYN